MLQNCYETLSILAMANLALSALVLVVFLGSPMREPDWAKWPTVITLVLWPVLAVAFIILKIIEVWV